MSHSASASGEAAQVAGLAKSGIGLYKAYESATGTPVATDSAVNTAGNTLSTGLAAYGAVNAFEKGGTVNDIVGAADTVKAASGAYSLAGGEASSAAGTALGTAGQAAGYVAAAYSLYNAVDQEKPGQTGGDTLRGAEAGAAIGSMVVPGIGTIIGGVIGGVVGAVGSLFGHTDTTSRDWQEFVHNFDNDQVAAETNSNYLISALGGLWRSQDGNFPGIKNFSDGNSFSTAMAGQIQQAVQSGKVSATADASTLYSQVVQPWLQSLPGGSNWTKSSVASQEGMLVQDLVSNYVQGKPITYQDTVGQKSNYTPFSAVTKAAPAATVTPTAKPAGGIVGGLASLPVSSSSSSSTVPLTSSTQPIQQIGIQSRVK